MRFMERSLNIVLNSSFVRFCINSFVVRETIDELIKRFMEISRVGIAINFKNPDGTPHYAINTSVKLSITPPNKTFTVQKNSIKGKNSQPPSQMFS